ncbi:MAG: single-stranded-DNA-specific exonuclease RecJ [Bacteroidales bacterium]|nr:single-stranded-DNA-specific exonuclease RecJ [Bacteroidales bacterium]
MEKSWIVKEQGDKKEVDSLAKALDIKESIANLLVLRDIKSFDKARQFFRPKLDELYDPFLMKDMTQAIDRIGTAINRHERILIYGDYDVDGTTAVALVYAFFRDHYDNLGFYIPNRYSEGYGISTQGIDFASENNYSLIIALDCGIKAINKVKYASQKNIDFIICDHHTPGAELPAAVAVLDPKRADCDYPFKELSGCGVGFKLVQAFARINSISFDSIIPLLDLVAVSIASDIVPIVDENRVLAFYGLQQLNADPRPGLKTICRLGGLGEREISISDVVFKIGPRINAAGRMETGAKAVELLLAEDDKQSFGIGNTINVYNQDRRKIDQEITSEALQTICQDHKMLNSKSTVIYNPSWHKGVIGIVASRLIETHYKPTVVLTESNGFATGSARSVPGFNLYRAIESCSHLLVSFGGHMYAAGLTLKKEDVEEFGECFEKAVSENITSEQLVPAINIDANLIFEDITPSFVRILNQFQPFGPENMAPVFVARNLIAGPSSKLVGANGEHIKMEVSQNGGSGIAAIAFNQSHNSDVLQNGTQFDICFTIEENVFRGNTSLQLNVKDIKKSNT